MYIRTISRKNKDGSTITYVQLAHNERTSGRGHPKAKILYNFGRIDSLDIEQLKRLVKSISRFLPPEEVLETQARLKYRGKTLRWSSCRSFGGSYLLSALWQKLNFQKLLEKLLASREFATPIAQAIFAMVANRCLAPASKLAISEWVQKDVYIPDLAEVDVQILYRAMDFLLLHQTKLEQEIYWAMADLLNLEVDLLFFDTTSTYFETEEETELKRRGYSKDKRADLPQVVIGLAVTRAGIPVKHWVFSGNTVDMSTIETVKKDLANWRLNRCVFVHDTGMTCEANLQFLQRGGGHYIVGRKMKSGEKNVQQALGHKGPYTQIQEDLWAKEVLVGDGEKRKRLILVKNAREQERAESARQKLLECLEKKLTALNGRKNTLHSKAVCELRSHPVYGKYVKELKSGKLSLKRTKLSHESRYDGKFLVETSDDTLSLKDVVLGYKQLYEIEAAFRTLKTTLDLHPNYHSKDERIRCHIFICFISLVLVRIAENQTGKTWQSIRKEMNRLYYGEFFIESQKICQLTELTKEQKSILEAMTIKEPSTVVGIHNA